MSFYLPGLRRPKNLLYGEEDVFNYKDSFFLLCGRQEKSFNRSRQDGRSARCACSNKALLFGRKASHLGAGNKTPPSFYFMGLLSPSCEVQYEAQSPQSWAGLLYPSKKKRGLSVLDGGYMIISAVLKYANSSNLGRSGSGCPRSGRNRDAFSGEWKKRASGPEQTATLERTQPEAQKLEQGQFADSVPKGHSVGHESRQCSGDPTVFVEPERDGRLPPALRDVNLEYRTSLLVASPSSAFIPIEYRAQLLITVGEDLTLPENFFDLQGISVHQRTYAGQP